MNFDKAKYFDARPQLKGAHNEKIFESGYERGYQAGQASMREGLDGRVKACLAACDGIDTETLLSTVGLDELYTELQKERDDAKAQLSERDKDSERLDFIFKNISLKQLADMGIDVSLIVNKRCNGRQAIDQAIERE